MQLAIDQPFDLKSTLESGQAHRWKKVDGWYSGVVRGEFIQIRQMGRTAEGPVVEFFSGPSPEAAAAAMLREYFRLDDDIHAIYSDIKRDSRVAEMVGRYPDYDPRLSGFLLGPEHIQGKGSIAIQSLGSGRVILFSMTPQFRAMTHGTYKLMFNAIFWAARQSELRCLQIR